MSDYATYQQVSRFLQGAAEADTEALSLSIAAASRLIDNLAEVSENFFAKAATLATAKKFSGSGAYLLRLPPMIENSLTAVAGFDITGLRVSGRPPLQFLAGSPYLFFAEFTEYEITARWGFSEVPADIQQAAVAMAVKMFRETDAATVKMTDTETVISQNVPPFVRDICESYRKKNLFLASI